MGNALERKLFRKHGKAFFKCCDKRVAGRVWMSADTSEPPGRDAAGQG